jgi:hypothetical protein
VTRGGKLAATGFAMVLGLALSGCGSDDNGGSATETKTIVITVSGDDITPNGDRIEVSAGQPIELVVTADAPGEIHVHSEPEQEFEYVAGDDQKFELTPIDRPGIVDIESHTLDKTIVQLEVR